MKKIQLKFQKKVISVLTQENLSQIVGGNTAFSYNSCPTVDSMCDTSNDCTDKDTVRGACLSNNKPGGNTGLQPYIPIHPHIDSAPCNSFESNCLLNPEYKIQHNNQLLEL